MKMASPNPTVGLANAHGSIGVTAQTECVTAPVASSYSYPARSRGGNCNRKEKGPLARA